MKDEFITFETAKLAKEKGFDEYCKYHFDQEGARFNNNMNPTKNSEWNNCMTQPTQSLLQRWLREVHNIYIFISSTRISDNKRNYEYDVQQDKDLQPVFYKDKILTYEQALEESLLKALELI